MVGFDDEPRSFVRALEKARAEAWTGRIAVSLDAREVGSVVMRAGRVAWAVCLDQPEDLGTFLWRLGRVTRSELVQIRRQYAEEEGRRKLGAIMEDAGIVNRQVLRRCLLLHTRRALARLLLYPSARVHTERADLRVDEEMTFSLNEALPPLGNSWEEMGRETRSATRWTRWTAENHVLSELSELPGYLAGAVVSSDGEVLAAHTEGKIDPVTVGVFVVSLLETSAACTRSAGLGEVDCLHFQCGQGTFVTQWLSDAHKHVAVAVVGDGGSIGMAKYKLSAMAPKLARWTRSQKRVRHAPVPREMEMMADSVR